MWNTLPADNFRALGGTKEFAGSVHGLKFKIFRIFITFVIKS